MKLRNRASAVSTWRRRDSYIALARAAVGVIAVGVLAFLGRPADAAPEHGPYINRPATTVEQLKHDLLHEFEMDKVAPSPTSSPDGNGWGSD